jgi:hypothetical protein
MKDLRDLEITGAEFNDFSNNIDWEGGSKEFNDSREFNCDFIVNDRFLITIEFSKGVYNVYIPPSDECFHKNPYYQQSAHEIYPASEAESFLEQNGIKKDYTFLKEYPDRFKTKQQKYTKRLEDKGLIRVNANIYTIEKHVDIVKDELKKIKDKYDWRAK